MYTALSAQLSGSLRHTHSRIAEFAEEIALLGGEEAEKMLLEREYANVVQHENHVLRRRWWFSCVEEGVIKWLWGSFGVSVVLFRSVVFTQIRVGSLFSVPFRYSFVCLVPATWVAEQKVLAP